MPRKIRELVRDLKKAGYELDRQRGSYRIFKHPKIAQHITISGHESDDAHHYQEKKVKEAIERASKAK
jgi:predicted RNA binding protein YcfA (HicA-like mRNA interferase family)